MPRRTVPLAILNSSPVAFHLLRYNREAHDITVERRSKSTGAMLAFTALKLDSVNANWFDYEDLDRWFFSIGPQVCFVFEKVTNRERNLYCKIVDTTGKSSGFIRLATTGNFAVADLARIKISRCGESGLVILKTRTDGPGMHTEADIFDLRQRKVVAVFRLKGALMAGRNAVLTNDSMLAHPLVSHGSKMDSVWIAFTRRDGQTSFIFVPTPRNLRIRELSLSNTGTGIELDGIGTIMQPDSATGMFFHIALNTEMMRIRRSVWDRYSAHVNEQLTFYDGPEKLPHLKQYRWVGAWHEAEASHYLYERRENEFAKEMLYLRRDPEGELQTQTVLPRKVLNFRNRNRYHYNDVPMINLCNGHFTVSTLESPLNRRVDSTFNYHKFEKETALWNANIVSYEPASRGLVRKIVHHNSAFDLVPMSYDACGRCGGIYYLTNGNEEKYLFTE